MKNLFLFIILITIIGCGTKIDLAEEIANSISRPTQQPLGQISTDAVSPPSDLLCLITKLDNNLSQAEAIFKNSDIRSYAGRDLTGYQFVWTIGNEKTSGFINNESIEEEIVGSSIVYDSTIRETQILFEVKSDYNDFISKSSSVECK